MNLTALLPIIVFVFFLICSWLTTKFFRIPQPPSFNRLEYIDGIRGIAAIAVVATHFWRTTPSASGVSFLFDGRENYGALGVQLFFCITGFLFFGQMFSKAGEFSWNSFYRSRARRIIPGYIAFCALGFTIVLIYGEISKINLNQLPNLLDMLFLGLEGNGVGKYFAGLQLNIIFTVIWTLRLEVLFYLAFPFVVYFIGRAGITTGFAILLTLVAYELGKTGQTYCGFFLSGGIAYLAAKRLNPSGLLKLFYGATSAFLTLYLLISDHSTYGWAQYLLASLLFISISIAKPKVLSIKPLTYLGDISYSIYLVHVPILILNRVVFAKVFSIGSYDWPGFFAITFTGVVIIFLFSALQYRYVELPFLRKPKHIQSTALKSEITS